ncbi:MAG: N-acetyltransferase [Ignavibacteriae bacterium]|nr:MAG: N-acetyltransferase [Ignavibacteriota bacterium]
MENIIFRKYSASDKYHVLRIFDLNSPQYFGLNEREPFSEYLDNLPGEYYVIEFAGSIIGCGGITEKANSNEVHLSWGMLHPEYHKKGIGKKFAEFRIDKIKQNFPGSICVVETTQKTFKFFEKLGFKLTHTQSNHFAEGLDLYRMEMSF